MLLPGCFLFGILNLILINKLTYLRVFLFDKKLKLNFEGYAVVLKSVDRRAMLMSGQNFNLFIKNFQTLQHCCVFKFYLFFKANVCIYDSNVFLFSQSLSCDEFF